MNLQDYEESDGFYNSSNVNPHYNEGERQKCHRYIVSMAFRFLSPTKLNRNEIAVYS